MGAALALIAAYWSRQAEKQARSGIAFTES